MSILIENGAELDRDFVHGYWSYRVYGPYWRYWIYWRYWFYRAYGRSIHILGAC
jgi:hypothetical protein